jgi:putative ABC transport system ATP-binding protein
VESATHPHGPTLLSAHRISKVFWMRGAKHPLRVFSGVSLTVRAGEMVALVGPSGSGKSTLLRCLAGLEPVTEGHVVLLETNLARASRTTLASMLRESVGLLMVNPPLVPSLTALQNVELPGMLAARASWSNRELALRTLEGLGARDVASKLPAQLTPPQAARVSLARLLTQSPKIAFADEPTGRLGVEDSELVLGALKKLAESGCAVVLATHDLYLAAEADRVITIMDGSLGAALEHPTPEQILKALDTSAAGRLAHAEASAAPVADAAPPPPPAPPATVPVAAESPADAAPQNPPSEPTAAGAEGNDAPAKPQPAADGDPDDSPADADATAPDAARDTPNGGGAKTTTTDAKGGQNKTEKLRIKRRKGSK